MIDTINLRIHNLKKYGQLYNQFYTTGKNSVSTAFVDEDTGEVIERNKIHALIYHDNDNIIPISQRNSFVIASSHYSVSYFINQNSDCLDINVSLPKAKYGCNILQLINYFDTSSAATFSYLKQEINKFFSTYFLEIPDYRDVEITRIDLCYNQFFDSTNDSIVYLEQQKKLLTKYARSSKNDFRTYDTSWMYKTARYTFKVYHKGYEFERNDLKHLQKNNPLNYDLKKLTQNAFKILRYEITIRPSYFRYLVNQSFVEDTARARKLAYLKHPVSNFIKKIKLLSPSHLEKIKRIPYRISLASMFDTQTQPDFLIDSDSITFDETIFQIIYDDFWKKISYFQLITKPPLSDILVAIRRRDKQKKVKQNSMLTLAALLSQHHSLVELYKTNLLPKSTYHKLRKELKEMGVTDESHDLEFMPPATDYVQYKQVFKNEHLQV